MSVKSKFSAAEWALVKDAHYWVYQALAKADGGVNIISKRKESKALDAAVASYRTTNALVNELKKNDEPSKTVSASTDAKAHENLAKIADAVGERLNARDLKSFNLFLMDIANAVAEAAGEGVLKAGEKISKNEAAALEKIEEALGSTLQAVQVEERREKSDAKRKQSAVVAAKRKETQKKAKLAEMKKREQAQKEAAAKRKAAASAAKREQAAATRKSAATAAAAKVAAAKAAAEAAEKARIQAEAAEQAREKRAIVQAKQRAVRAKEARAKADAKAKWDAEQKIKEDNRKKWMAEQAEKDKWIGEHTVVAGDNLGAISLKYYNSAAKNMWMRIYEANKHIIGDNPNMIQIGQKLRIPK